MQCIPVKQAQQVDLGRDSHMWHGVHASNEFQFFTFLYQFQLVFSEIISVSV